MKDKYYIPTFEELITCFVQKGDLYLIVEVFGQPEKDSGELIKVTPDGDSSKGLHSLLESFSGFPEEGIKEMDLSRFRIKYLDKEDIESLGFLDISRTRGNYDSSDRREKLVFLLNTTNPSIKTSEERVRLVLRVLNNGEIIIQKRYYYVVGQGCSKYGSWRYEGSSILFHGEIKNKSELIKLLKQLDENT